MVEKRQYEKNRLDYLSLSLSLSFLVTATQLGNYAGRLKVFNETLIIGTRFFSSAFSSGFYISRIRPPLSPRGNN